MPAAFENENKNHRDIPPIYIIFRNIITIKNNKYDMDEHDSFRVIFFFTYYQTSFCSSVYLESFIDFFFVV